MVKRRLPTGWVEVICGGMYSGKTEELIRRVRRAEIAEQKVQIFRPSVGGHYRSEKISTHDGMYLDATVVGRAKEIPDLVDADTMVVAIDEGQFFDQEIVDICDALADDGKRVIVAGLDLDFRGEPFGPMPLLMTRAEVLLKLQAICVVCGAPAGRTQRLVGGKPAAYDGPTILFGTSQMYEARCRCCHRVLNRQSPSAADQKTQNCTESG